MATSDSAQDSIFDKVAKESDHSTASSHPTHQGKQEQAHAYDHQSKGPQLSDNLPEAKGKDELKAKAQEMNDHVSK
ncbi:hypothetical protein A1O7_03655 [Cladophialophora yegresii CBS 114405]|uniref:Uncharacterized protein n=1 Tax=Cladophialophora yegresii CBS 114405 TaxID=1182544 RepID=W9W5H2_9EURO|nr:uncharacterized protein A1O7_03655 [Cladophialophora yegresii CBS 114405]EXJ63208.1 hypothetical protein A1O7_03655 [Cladophialophora yegresii CBS 114405]